MDRIHRPVNISLVHSMSSRSVSRMDKSASSAFTELTALSNRGAFGQWFSLFGYQSHLSITSKMMGFPGRTGLSFRDNNYLYILKIKIRILSIQPNQYSHLTHLRNGCPRECVIAEDPILAVMLAGIIRFMVPGSADVVFRTLTVPSLRLWNGIID